MGSVAVDRELVLGSLRLTDQYRSLSEAGATEALDAKTGASKTMVKEPGLLGYGVSGEALWKGGAFEIDDVLFGLQGVRGVPFSLMLEDGDIGSPARIVLASLETYSIGAEHGDLVTAEYGLMSQSTPHLGTVLHNAEVMGASSEGAAVQLGAVLAGGRLQGALHVCGGAGRVTVRIQSDNAQAFPSPTTRLTFSVVATGVARAYEWAGVLGPFADTWWRVVVLNQTAASTRDVVVVAAII